MERVRPILLLHEISDERAYGRGKKSFNASVDDVTLLVEGGESIGILGGRRDGAGLLAEIIGGLRNPVSGRTFVDGEPVVLDDAGAFLAEDTLHFNMVRFGMAHQMSGQRLRNAVEIVAAEAGIGTESLQQEVGNLDVEVVERVRVYLAMATGTKLLVIEESEAVFDLLQQEAEHKKINAFRRRGGSLIVISHELRNFSGIADRTCWLREGRIIMDDETEAVTRWHKQLKTAERAKDRARASQLLRRFEGQYESPVVSLRGRSGSRAV